MPRVRKGPSGPRSSLAGKKGTNRKTPSGGARTSGNSHASALKFNRRVYGK